MPINFVDRIKCNLKTNSSLLQFKLSYFHDLKVLELLSPQNLQCACERATCHETN